MTLRKYSQPTDKRARLIAYEKAPDVETVARRLVDVLTLTHIDINRVFFYRSTGSKSRLVQARIHGMGRIWYDALAIQPRYIIEVISEEYDKLDDSEKDKVVLHELMHIPSKFSGGFVPHKGKINRRSVDRMYAAYLAKSGTFSKEQF